MGALDMRPLTFSLPPLLRWVRVVQSGEGTENDGLYSGRAHLILERTIGPFIPTSLFLNLDSQQS